MTKCPDQRTESPLQTSDPTPHNQLPAEIIPPVLDTALRTAGVDTRDPNVSKALEISLMMYSGTLPLPPPPVLAAYADAFPGLVEQIVSWTDEQRQHRFDLERERAKGSEARLDRAQRNAFMVACGGLVLAAIVGVLGNPWVAGIIAIVGVGGPTAAVALAARQAGTSSSTTRSAPASERKPSPPKRS